MRGLSDEPGVDRDPAAAPDPPSYPPSDTPSYTLSDTPSGPSAAGSWQRADLRETYRQQLLAGIGGWSGSVIAAIPTVVFVVVNAVASLRSAIFAAVGTAVVLAVYRAARRQPVQQAIGGLFAVVVAAAIAGGTGQARGYFLFGIWSSFAYAAFFAGSMLLRRPIIGVLWEFLDPAPAAGDTAAGDTVAGDTVAGDTDAQQPVPWHRRRALFRGYLGATLIGTALFASRGIVQLALYKHNATGWLAFAKVAMGFPLYAIAVAAGFWLVTRARRREQLAA